MEALKEDVIKYSDSYNWERAKRLGVLATCIYYALKRLNVSYKKFKTPKGEQRRTAEICEENKEM